MLVTGTICACTCFISLNLESNLGETFIMNKHRSLTSSKSAFTLIELLVVIAIIAILAAILFPVFAQAKLAAKKAAAISQTKQAGTGMVLYTSDSDDLYPAGTVPIPSDPTIKYNFGAGNALTPAGWDGDLVKAEGDNLIWANTTQPYIKNYDMMLIPGTNVVTSSLVPLPNSQQKPVSMSFNGLLQYYSTTAVEAQSKLTVLWPGYGNYGIKGATYLSPRLNCNGVGACRYNPGGLPQTMASGFPQSFIIAYTPSFYAFGTGSVHVFADTSAKLIPYGNGNQGSLPATANRQVVWNYIDTRTGTNDPRFGIAFRGMGGLRGANYAAAFCPDNSFAN
jgi:prepilin-type N-terminal cleavage/methylation domain-containing protein